MSVQLVVDMNLSEEWVTELATHGWSAVHWSGVGDPRASDSVIMAWALANQHVVFTHDLDFSTTLALTHATGPSVLQVRGQYVLPEDIGPIVISALRQNSPALPRGRFARRGWKVGPFLLPALGSSPQTSVCGVYAFQASRQLTLPDVLAEAPTASSFSPPAPR